MNNDTRTTPSASSATRAAIRARYAVDEADAVRQLADRLALAPERRNAITGEAALLTGAPTSANRSRRWSTRRPGR